MLPLRQFPLATLRMTTTGRVECLLRISASELAATYDSNGTTSRDCHEYEAK